MTFDGAPAGGPPEAAPTRRGLVSHLRHELATPLNAIIGYSEMLLEDPAGGGGPEARADLDSIHRTGQALLAIVGEFLDSVRAEAGLIDLPLPTIGAAIRERVRAPLDVVLDAADRLAQQAAADGLSGRAEDLGRIQAAGRQLGALLGDLTPLVPPADDPGASATTEAAVAEAATPNASTLGPAADEGLAAGPNEEAFADEGPTVARTQAVVPRTQPARLLVVDDSDANRDILSRILRRQGHSVQAASGGREALALLAGGGFDLVLLDILMPEMNGFELLGRVKADPALRRLPVILISALDDATGKVQAFRAGGADYVTKPFQAEEVVARVENQLKISRLQADLARQNEELLRKNEELVRAQRRTDLVFSALADALPGTVLDGKYRLDEKIGAGGFGAVFRGLHLGLDLAVAIKVFRPIVGNDTPEALERFRQEGIAASRIRHPNAIEILDNGISSTGIAYLVMELMQGRTLAAELKERGSLPLDRTAAILVPVCEALAEVHAAGIVHRDITPDNIFLHRGRKGEVVKLLDFGLSKMLAAAADTTSATLTITGSVAGTPAYMAPERLTNGACDGRSDVYSIGVIMYRMLSGRPPFVPGDGGQFALALMHVTAEPPALPAMGKPVPPGLEILVRRTMAKDPAERPTAAELGGLLQRFASRPRDWQI